MQIRQMYPQTQARLLFGEGTARKIHMRIYTDGHQLYIAYVNITTNEKKLRYTANRVPFTQDLRRLGNTIYEYEAIYEALQSVKPEQSVEIFSDCRSAIMVLSKGMASWGLAKGRKNGTHTAKKAIKQLIKQKQLKVSFVWIPRYQNPAGSLIDKKLGKFP